MNDYIIYIIISYVIITMFWSCYVFIECYIWDNNKLNKQFSLAIFWPIYLLILLFVTAPKTIYKHIKAEMK